MTINEAYLYIQGKARENQVGHIPTNTLNVYFERAQLEEVNSLWGNRQEYSPGMPIPRTGGGERNQVIVDELRTLVQVNNFAQPRTSLTGMIGSEINIPSDYLYLINLQILFFKNATSTSDPELRFKDVEIITHAELSARMGSQIDQIDTAHPIGIFTQSNLLGDKIEIIDDGVIGNVMNGRIVYVRKPVAPKWAFTTQSGQQIFDSVNSQDFELPETRHNGICERVLSYIGLSTRDEQLRQSSEQQQAKGV